MAMNLLVFLFLFCYSRRHSPALHMFQPQKGQEIDYSGTNFRLPSWLILVQIGRLKLHQAGFCCCDSPLRFQGCSLNFSQL